MSHSQPYSPPALTQGVYPENRSDVLPPQEETSFGHPNTVIDLGSTVTLQSWFSWSPWRLTSGWMMFAALISVGVFSNVAQGQDLFPWQTLALLLLLVDPLWGGIWRFAWGREVLLPLGNQQKSQRFWLPYLKPGSPAARLAGTENSAPGQSRQNNQKANHQGSQTNHAVDETDDDLIPLLFRIGVPTLLLAFGVAATINAAALWMTAGVVLCGILGWTSRRTLGSPAMILQTVVVVIMPWVLTTVVMNAQATILPFSPVRISYSYWLMGFWALHYWGIHWYQMERGNRDTVRPAYGETSLAVASSASAVGYPLSGRDLSGREIGRSISKGAFQFIKTPALLPLILADLGIFVMLILLKEPLWLALLGPLWLPMWLAYYQQQPLDRQPIWRLAAVLITTIAIGQTPV